MEKIGIFFTMLMLLGAGCIKASTEVSLCYLMEDGRMRIVYDSVADDETYEGVSLGVPAVLTITDAMGNDPMQINGYWRGGDRFVYPTGDSLEVVGDALVSHSQTPASEGVAGLDSFAATIATKTECL